MSNKLPKDWKHINLGSIAKVKGGKRLPKGHTYATEITNLPYIRVTDFGNQTISFEKLKHLNTDTQKVIKNYTISNEDVYISIAGTIGVTGIIPQKLNGANLTENAAKITELIDCDKKFLSRFLSSLDGQSQIKESTKTTTQPKLSLYRIAEIIIPLPPLEIQHAIVSKIEELFSELDKGIEDLKIAQQQLKTYRQSVLKWAFEGKLTNENVKDGELPKGWEIYKIGEVCKTVDGDRGPNYPKKEEFSKEGFCLYLSTKNVREDRFLFDETIFITKEKDEKLRSGKLQLNDVVITTRGTLGNVALYDSKIPFQHVRINSGMLILRITNELLSNYYLMKFITSPIFINQLKNKQTGTAQPQIPANILREIEIPLPITLKEQHQIVQEIESRLSVADKMEESIVQSLLQAESLRQSILKKAFEGKLV
tara:strand:- start:5395 stop:6669 length:1275 start_codon:yes stop_codon:yes gene_type:complete